MLLAYANSIGFLIWGYTKWCWWWFFNTIFCIHKISSQCYKMKLYQCSWIYHSHLRFRLTLRDIHRWFAARSSFANQRQEFIHESTPAETQAVLICNCTNLKKTRRNRREQKNSTPFLKWSFRGHQHHLTKTLWFSQNDDFRLSKRFY